MINAGELDKQIMLQKKTSIPDGDGYPVDTWHDLGTVWASIITTGGREFYAAQKTNAETTAVIKIRYRRNITQDMRIMYGRRIFEILSIADPEEKHEELLLGTKELI
jgi:SPP1 family predicted phage head-tail adaptor